jgi:hypothetical protein
MSSNTTGRTEYHDNENTLAYIFSIHEYTKAFHDRIIRKMP